MRCALFFYFACNLINPIDNFNGELVNNKKKKDVMQPVPMIFIFLPLHFVCCCDSISAFFFLDIFSRKIVYIHSFRLLSNATVNWLCVGLILLLFIAMVTFHHLLLYELHSLGLLHSKQSAFYNANWRFAHFRFECVNSLLNSALEFWFDFLMQTVLRWGDNLHNAIVNKYTNKVSFNGYFFAWN